MEKPKVLTHKEFSSVRYFLQWEWILLIIFILVNIMNASFSDNYLKFDGLMRASMIFLDKGFIVFPMALVIIMGDIDISVSSTVALSSVVMATVYNAGVPMGLAILICLGVGALCGLINGILVVKFKELAAVIITLSTMTLYRGIAYIILKNQSAGGFPKWFSELSWGFAWKIPYILIVFVFFAAIFTLVLHKTNFGRYVFAIGNNDIATRFSGINVDHIKIIVFTLVGVMASICAIFLSAKMMSTRPNVASGYELDVIAMVVLGGISTAGGKGKMIGVITAVFLLGFLQYGLGLINVQSQIIIIITGLLLILAVAIPNIQEMIKNFNKKREVNL